jgi:glycosyltransferase involved in cell wall biosynthesis
MPTIDLSLAATEFGTKMNIPVVLDIRDMWPDIFLEAVPFWANGICRVMLSPMFRNLTKACEDATAIFGITDEFLEWGLKYAGRNRNSFDSVFYHGYSPVRPTQDGIIKAQSFWKKHGIFPDNGQFIACFFGYFGRQFELETVLEAARKLQNSKVDIRFVLCGNGENFEHYKATAKDLNNVVMSGFVGHPEIWTLMKMASAGLAPYKSTPSFVASLPNKVGEYLSVGLPIISSLKGSLEHLLDKNQCGITYSNCDDQELAAILYDLHENRTKLDDMAAKVGRVFRENFFAERVYGNMIVNLEFISKQHNISV